VDRRRERQERRRHDTAPRASDVQTANVSGGTAGKPEPGDSITFTYSEQMDPDSLLSDWDGSSMNVVVVLIDGGNSDDTLQVWNVARQVQVPFGTVDLGRKDYLTNGSSITFGITGTPSTMVQDGSAIAVTLGTPSATGGTAAASGSITWTPSSSATDRAGNAASTSSVTEKGSGDKDF
jgi:hypothetical protein